jgi:hypothetical protein
VNLYDLSTISPLCRRRQWLFGERASVKWVFFVVLLGARGNGQPASADPMNDHRPEPEFVK